MTKPHESTRPDYLQEMADSSGIYVGAKESSDFTNEFYYDDPSKPEQVGLLEVAAQNGWDVLALPFYYVIEEDDEEWGYHVGCSWAWSGLVGDGCIKGEYRWATETQAATILRFLSKKFDDITQDLIEDHDYS